MKSIQTLTLIMLLASVTPALRAEGNKLDVQPADTVHSVLEHQVGQVVELRLKAGDKIGGKVEKVSTKLLQLSQLLQEHLRAVQRTPNLLKQLWRGSGLSLPQRT